jgi:hypothetical protein
VVAALASIAAGVVPDRHPDQDLVLDAVMIVTTSFGCQVCGPVPFTPFILRV